ncbi:spore germination protein [Bacillus sp. DNRA2]|uniref:spore germination protein n=1 Tax=Bacillus sp. DNRA2 TaxID=2723053 RepID=UPI00145CF7FF|nr:spore germination protein [Bacillus sp. DNRA2]NMD69182.1 spore germination protein [Bacillus sp. DNRA2]
MKKLLRPKPISKLKEPIVVGTEKFASDLELNIQILKDVFQHCSDIVFRSLLIGGHEAVLIFIEGIVETIDIEFHGLTQLQDFPKGERIELEQLKEKIVAIAQVDKTDNLQDVITKILHGESLLLVDGVPEALVLSAKGGIRRGVSEPETETSIRGPREGFTENIRVNTALVRQKIRSSHLKMISKEVGTETKTLLAILYMDHLAPKELVDEVLSRIDRINIDGILESGYIEELIEDNPWSIFPQIQNTERPDTVAANLLEGRVCILINGTPFSLVLPATFWMFMQASEDYYQRFHISFFLRWLRVILVLLALALPAFYIAITTYHQEMIPTTLLYSIAASREAIPFPAFIEALIMELAFEALREAGIRLPKVIGQAVSILGALVIGSAAVEAGIVSAPMVIVVSITGIASFTIPRFNMAISIRLLRFPMMMLAAAFGLLGIVVGSTFLLTHLCKLRSFGVPYFAPVGPLNWSELKDVFIRAPWWALDKRPTQVIKGNVVRQAAGLFPGTNGSSANDNKGNES